MSISILKNNPKQNLKRDWLTHHIVSEINEVRYIQKNENSSNKQFFEGL